MATANFTTKPPMRDKLGMLVDEDSASSIHYIVRWISSLIVQATSHHWIIDGLNELNLGWSGALGKVVTQNTSSRAFSALTPDLQASEPSHFCGNARRTGLHVATANSMTRK
jgi:hypothetical protein